MRIHLLCLAGLALAACAGPADDPAAAGADQPKAQAPEIQIVPDIEQRLAKFSPTPLQADLSALSPEDRHVLDLLVQAARQMDEIFLRQVWTGNPELRDKVQSWTDKDGKAAVAAREFFEINAGPWDRLDGFKPFLGDKPHPEGAGYYPEDITKQEFESWVEKHAADKERFTSGTTVIRRDGTGLKAVPYSQEYRQWLQPAAKLLRQAAAATSNASLKRFLELRATAFETDDYYESDVAWMDLDAPVEVTIGPYETYEDTLFGYKAAFEAFVTVNLPKESAALTRYKERLPWLEGNLPIPDKDKNPNRGTESPIRVVDTVFTAGDTKAGVQTLAFNLPNDERVREAKGSKKVLLRNTMRAKYDKILMPIAERVIAQDQLKDVAFDAYFNEVLHHELSHGLGPGTITKNGKKTEVRLELKDLFGTLEEAKADVMGVYNILALMQRGDMPADLRRTLEPTYVAGLFRSARFGVHEAHGQGVVAQFTYLMKKGALEVDEAGRFRAVSEKFPGAIRDLLHDMLTLQAAGDYEGTKAFLDKYGKPEKSLLDAIERLADVPVDIRPVYTYAEK
ncbi:MAG: dipeptidyl-peptidase 3 family protein [Thermoanaerobaculia bacterium]